MDLPSDDDPADKVDYLHRLEVVGSVESRRVRDREGSIEVGTGGDVPCAREVRAGEQGGSVLRNVANDGIDEFLRKPHTGSAHAQDPLYLPV